MNTPGFAAVMGLGEQKFGCDLLTGELARKLPWVGANQKQDALAAYYRMNGTPTNVGACTHSFDN